MTMDSPFPGRLNGFGAAGESTFRRFKKINLSPICGRDIKIFSPPLFLSPHKINGHLFVTNILFMCIRNITETRFKTS
jgi:hypothetical protein